MTDQELLTLLKGIESDRVELKSEWSNAKDKIKQAICAFANDLPKHQQPGVVFIGVHDNGDCANLPITDQLLQQIAQCKDDGSLIPFPTLVVQKRTLNNCELAVIIVEPSHSPPIRYRGRVWIRVGPRRAIATVDDERILSEKRRARNISFDLTSVYTASLDDLDLNQFSRLYLPSAVAFDVLEENNRPVEHQLSALRFINSDAPSHPTVLGLLTIGKAPRKHLYGAYVQFLRINGALPTDPIIDQKELDGALPDLLRLLDDLLTINITTRSNFVGAQTEQRRTDYPIDALRQLIRNAILHRTYEATNAPVRLSWFNDRVEIFSPGGLFGQVNETNLGQGVTDYRNPHIAEAMKNLGYVQRFGAGIPLAQKQLKDNGNPPAEFTITPNNVLVTVKR